VEVQLVEERREETLCDCIGIAVVFDTGIGIAPVDFDLEIALASETGPEPVGMEVANDIVIEVFPSLPSPTVVHLLLVEGQEKQISPPTGLSLSPDSVSSKDSSSSVVQERAAALRSWVSRERKT